MADPVEDAQPPIRTRVDRKVIPIDASPELDLLFVVDNSPEMAPFQAILATNVATFAETLASGYGGLPDLHVGVITTDPGDDGVLQSDPMVDGRFITDRPRLDFSRQRNYEHTLADVMVASANVGAHGSSAAQPLAMIERALSNPANAGFRRASAQLSIVLVTAHDDRSPDAVSSYALALRQLSDNPAYVVRVVAAFGGDSSVCSIEPAPRLAQLLALFPDRSASSPLCWPDWSPLAVFARPLFWSTLPLVCMEHPLADGDPARDGAQYVCTAELQLGDAAVAVPACELDPRLPCWQIDHTPICTSSGAATDEELRFVRDSVATPRGAQLVVECLLP